MAATEPGAPNGAWSSAPGGTPDHLGPGHVPRRTEAPCAPVPVPRASAPDESCALTFSGAPSGLAWLVRAVTHVPGVLHLVDGRLRFVSTRGVIVDGTPASLALTPARTGRGGFRLTVGDERLRLHVVRFAGAVDVPAELSRREVPGVLLTAGEPTAGAVWRRLLTPSHPIPDVAGPTAADTDAPEPQSPPVGTIKTLGWRPARARRACAAPARWC